MHAKTQAKKRYRNEIMSPRSYKPTYVATKDVSKFLIVLDFQARSLDRERREWVLILV